MRRLLLAAMCVFAVSTGFTQLIPVNAEDATTPEAVIEKYGSFDEAIFGATRGELIVLRTWESYDERYVRELIWERKNTPEKLEQAQLRKQQRMARSLEDCSCWVEPTDEYTQITTTMWDQTGGAGADVDAWLGPIPMNGSFSLFGTEYAQFYINSKGTISFGAGYIDWTPDEFPAATYNQVAGYWADIDIRNQGSIWYNVTDEAVFVNFIDVDYFNAQAGGHLARSNTFQMVITYEGSNYLGDGVNVELCYLDMGWAHGDVGGNGGFSGPNPGICGADLATGAAPGLQFGTFNVNSDIYDGPNGQEDGIDWLDDRSFRFNVAGADANIAPIGSFPPPCDTITVCLNDTLDLGMSFLSPEFGQTTTITTSPEGNGFTVFGTSVANTAVLDAIFVGSLDNLGYQEIVITATDDGFPAGVTELVLPINVIDTELPALTVDGVLSICATESSILTASDGFDEYLWSFGCDTQDCEHFIQGAYSVAASLNGCVANRDFNFEVAGFDLLDITFQSPICNSDSSFASVVDPEQYVSIEIVADFNGGGGEVYETNGFDEFFLSPGTYQVIGETLEGCPKQRVFNVIGANAVNIPTDIWSGAYCDGPEPVEFDGAVGDENCGVLNLYMISGDGWGDGFLILRINGGNDEILLADGPSALYNFNICAGDEIEIEFVSDGFGDDNKSVTLFNCGTQITIDDLSGGSGIIYSEVAECEFEPPAGEWLVCEGDGGSFSATDQFNTTFTPDDFGVYELCFVDENCVDTTSYFVEFNEFPAITLLEDNAVICPGETFEVQIQSTNDPGGTGVIEYPDNGPVYGPYNGYYFLEDEVTLTNGCGTAAADLTVQGQINPQPDIEDAILCDGSELELVASDNPTPDYIYTWTLNGDPLSEDSNELEIAQSGIYVVNISNECFPGGNSDEADITVGAVVSSDVISPETIDCNGNGTATICPNLTSDFNITWPDNTTGVGGDCFVTTNQGTFTFNVADNGDCFEGDFSTNVTISEAGGIDPSPTTLVTLCPEVESVFSLNSPTSTNFSWFIECDAADEPIIALSETSGSVVITSDMIPEECWDIVEITGTASNVCGTQSATFLATVDACEITIPNVFTPNNDEYNNEFKIDGLEVYSGVKFTVYNRWGNIVFETDDYQNDGDSSNNWKGRDEPEGTYFYHLTLPNGFERNGIITILR